jgi:hypothetical protein
MIAGDFSARGDTLVWKPSRHASRWLKSEAAGVFRRLEIERVQARLELFGNRLWAKDDPGRLLDGDLFPDPGSETGVSYPSGDGVRGGDLRLEFLLG